MREEIAVYSSRFSTPASQESIDRAARECLAYQHACNDAWGNDNLLLIELREKRARYARLNRHGDETDHDEEEALRERIDEIEREYPFLEDPDFGVEDDAPFPELL